MKTSASSNLSESEIDERVAALVDVEEPDLMYDLHVIQYVITLERDNHSLKYSGKGKGALRGGCWDCY